MANPRPPGNPNWQKGVSANPKGRKPGSISKTRQIALLLDEEWNLQSRYHMIWRVIEAVDTGYLRFPDDKKNNTKAHRLKLNAKEWMHLCEFVTALTGGPLKIDMRLMHNDVIDAPFVLPPDKLAPSFWDPYRDITQQRHTEYIFKGGRGSTKSSFVSLVIIYLLKNNPAMHALALRQVADTLRDSVYAQLQWAIGELGLSDEFKCTVSPMEIEYLPTGQKIYFRGANDPGKIKSIKPTFGYIGIVWFEELDQFHGAEAVRKIEQSVARGGDDAYIFKSFNPPPTANNWANKYVLIPKGTQYQHTSTYLDVPPEWLGKTWLEEAEHLRVTNPTAYENEYMGIATNIGGAVFTNVEIRKITDDEIAQFDRVLRGLDWGFYPDPFSFGVMHYDAARRTLYIFGEARYWKKSNEDAFKQLVADGLISKTEYKERGETIVSYPDSMIADSAEPKSVGDFKAYGANIRGAEKGPESVKYSIKWLQGLTAIVIDNERAPYHAEEFLNYEYERTRDDEIINEFPDKNNHAIDDTRYATNLIWRKRGE